MSQHPNMKISMNSPFWHLSFASSIIEKKSKMKPFNVKGSPALLSEGAEEEQMEGRFLSVP
jgi:hypothetical protein